MKKLLLSVGLALVVFGANVAGVGAASYNFEVGNLDNLNHWSYYTVVFQIDPGEQIDSATLTIRGLFNGTPEDTQNTLFVHLLDASPQSVGPDNFLITSGIDDGYIVSDQFGQQGGLILTYHDPDYWLTRDTLVLDFNELGVMPLLRQYSADGYFALSFDPDCHFYNGGINLGVNPVPEPATLLLFGAGLIGIGAWRHRKI